MNRAIIVLFCEKENEFINIEADRLAMTEDHLLVYNGDKLVGVFALTEVRDAHLTIKK